VTAIFAYVSGGRALLAADTLRVDPAGLFPNQMVGKIYCWANCIAFAGAGNGPRIATLANQMISAQGDFSPDEDGFLDSFRKYQPLVYGQATSGTSVMTRMPSLSTGTLLAAIPAMGGKSEHILQLDFVTGSVRQRLGRLAAEGTDSAALLSIGSAAQIALQKPTGLPGDLWARRCIAEAVGVYPKAIGFPFDILTTEQESNDVWIAHMARFPSVSTSASTLFHVR
jgi:hypothetical protein